MPNSAITTIKRLNPFLDVSFSDIASNKTYDYHAEAAWPVNILSFFSETNRETTIRNPLDGECLQPRAGWVLFIPCGLKTLFNVNWHTDVSLHFNLTFCHGVDLFQGGRKFIQRRDPALVKRMKRLAESPGRLKDICEMKAEVMRFCVSIWPEDAEKRSSPAIMKYEKVFRLVQESCDASMTVSFLAETMGKRQNVFSREFSRDIGRTPKEFLLDELLKKTSQGLLVQGRSVKDVARELNFCSEFYLSSFFKRMTGLSPSEYQAKFRN